MNSTKPTSATSLSRSFLSRTELSSLLARKRNGFTLIELMVVVIIIGILAAFIVPAIMGAVRKSKEFTVQSELRELEGALEKFKNKYGVYPVDFGNPYVLNEFIRRIAPNEAYGDIVNESDLADTDFWFAATIYDGRRPQTIDRAEALVLWLGGVSTNSEFPLGVLADFSEDPNYDAEKFFDFDETRLKDLDEDGWFEYYPASGPENPYVYFDSRTLRATNVPNAEIADVINQSVYPSIHSPELFSGQVKTNPPIASNGQPIAAYLNSDSTAFVNATDNKKSYQLICAGLDGEFGAELDASTQYDYTSGTTSVQLIVNKNEESPDLNITSFRPHRDNITNMKDRSRLDVHN